MVLSPSLLCSTLPFGRPMPLLLLKGTKRTQGLDSWGCLLDLPDRTSYNPGRQLERIAWRQCEGRCA
jgi:hypothetical protein